MLKTLPMAQARAKLPDLSKTLTRSRRNKTVAITQRGKRVLAVMPWDEYESLIETMEILSDRPLMHRIRRSIKQADAGQFVTLEDVERRLDL